MAGESEELFAFVITLHKKTCSVLSMKRSFLACFVIIFLGAIGGSQNVFAVPTIVFDQPQYFYNDGAIGSPEQPFITVTDPAAVGTVVVHVTSTSFPSGINLTLTETAPGSGIFVNTDIIFLRSPNDEFPVGRTITITINDPTQITNPAIVETLPLSAVASTTDSLMGINPLNLVETGPGTGIFSTKVKLSTNPTSSNSIQVTAGDVLSIFNLNSGLISNALITPPRTGIGAIYAQVGDTITASYPGAVSATATIGPDAPGGGGGGGLITPTLVLDAILGTGGSPYVVSPPSFGGSYYRYSDGLTLTQGNHKTIFDTSQFNQEIPTQVMVKGENVNMTFKTFESYNVKGVIGMTLFFVQRSQNLDIDVSQSLASIEWKKGKPVEVDDPNHTLSDVTSSSNSDNKFQYTQFSFTPTKSYDKMSFLVRAWNDHYYTRAVRIHDAIDVPLPVKTLPVGVMKYERFDQLQTALSNDKFYKPSIMNHIHDTNAVFPNPGIGSVYWLYDTINHTVTLVVSDKNDNELFSHQSYLQPYVTEEKGDYKFMYFTVDQLNRWNEKQEQKAMEVEAEKATAVAMENGLIYHKNW